MKRTILAALLATGALVSAQASAAAWGDENDLSWLPKANPQAQTQTKSSAVTASTPATKQEVRFGDENDTSWLYRPAGR